MNRTNRRAFLTSAMALGALTPKARAQGQEPSSNQPSTAQPSVGCGGSGTTSGPRSTPNCLCDSQTEKSSPASTISCSRGPIRRRGTWPSSRLDRCRRVSSTRGPRRRVREKCPFCSPCPSATRVVARPRSSKCISRSRRTICPKACYTSSGDRISSRPRSTSMSRRRRSTRQKTVRSEGRRLRDAFRAPSRALVKRTKPYGNGFFPKRFSLA